MEILCMIRIGVLFSLLCNQWAYSRTVLVATVPYTYWWFRIKVQVPKGNKELIETHRKAKGYKSLNSYVNDLITRDMAGTGAGDKTVNIGHDNIDTINM